MSFWNRKADPTWVPDAWPGDAATVERRLRTELFAEIADSPDLRITGVDDIRTTVDLDGTEIAHLLIDATGVKLKMKPGSREPGSSEGSGAPTSGGPTSGGPGAGGPGSGAPGAGGSRSGGPASGGPASDPEPEPDAEHEPAVIERTPGVLRFARVTADPVTVQGYDIHIDATLQNVAFDWARYAEPLRPHQPETAFGIADPVEMSTPTGTFTARMRADELGPLIESAARPLLKESGMRLRRFETSVTADAEQNVMIDGIASVRWKIFYATLRAHAEVHVDPDAIITVKAVRLSSRNPLIALGLRMMREELRGAEGQRFDMNADMKAESTPRALGVHDLRVRVTQSIEVSGRIG